MIKDDYTIATEAGLTKKDRWGQGIAHHPMSERIGAFLRKHDAFDYNDYFDWRFGGDGDNGETLLFQLDAFFEMLDQKPT